MFAPPLLNPQMIPVLPISPGVPPDTSHRTVKLVSPFTLAGEAVTLIVGGTDGVATGADVAAGDGVGVTVVGAGVVGMGGGVGVAVGVGVCGGGALTQPDITSDKTIDVTIMYCNVTPFNIN